MDEIQLPAYWAKQRSQTTAAPYTGAGTKASSEQRFLRMCGVCVCTRTVDTEVILNLPDLQEIQRQKLCFVLATGFCTLSLSKKGLVLFFFLIRTYLFLRDIFCILLTEIFFSNPFW